MRFALHTFMAASLASLSAGALAQSGSEMDFLDRCAVQDNVSVFSRSQSEFPEFHPIMGGEKLTGVGTPPSLMVDGWKPTPKAADKLLEELGKEAGFTVLGLRDLPIVAWNNPKASLRETIDTLAREANVSWSYSNGALTLLQPEKTISGYRAGLPSNRDARLAFVDILRGNGADVVVNSDYVTVSGSADSIAKARSALTAARQILVFDVLFLRGRPDAGRYDWNTLGMSTAAVNDAGGQFSTTLAPSDVIARLKAQGDIHEESGQTVGAPTGWAVAVPPSQCGRGTGEIVVAPKFDGERIQAKISGNGFAADYAGLQLGSSMFVAAPQPSSGWIDMVFIRPRVVAFSN